MMFASPRFKLNVENMLYMLQDQHIQSVEPTGPKFFRRNHYMVWLGWWYILRKVWRYPRGVKQEQHTLPEHLSSPHVFSGVRVARSLVFCVVFCRLLFFVWSFFFWPYMLQDQHIQSVEPTGPKFFRRNHYMVWLGWWYILRKGNYFVPL
jgi:hypothetical protein